MHPRVRIPFGTKFILLKLLFDHSNIYLKKLTDLKNDKQ